jgi:ABC-2 type transport system ATP-binding protein
MSQGEQQRIAIIRALCKYPEFLLMDEPTSSVDPLIKAKIKNILLLRSKEKKMSFLIATHDWEFVNELADKFIIIKNHQLKLFENIEDAIKELSGLQK